jgi:hypothetical protein
MFESHKYHIQLQHTTTITTYNCYNNIQLQWSYERLYITEEEDTDVAHNVQTVQTVQTMKLAFIILNMEKDLI